MNICSLPSFKYYPMARVKKDRLVKCAPGFGGFKPFGVQTTNRNEVNLHFEEYEAIKLCDYDMLTHQESAGRMGISRPTFSRIYESARQKVARAMVEAAIIRMDGGNAIIDAEWLTCDHCKISFSLLPKGLKQCPFCKSKALAQNI